MKYGIKTERIEEKHKKPRGLTMVKHMIEQGILNKTQGTTVRRVPYEVILLDKRYLPAVLALQDYVSNSLEDDQTFVTDSKEFMEEEILAPGKGKMLGVLCEQELIAYRNISFPCKGSTFNLGIELEIDPQELDKVAVLEATVVHPNYRGNALQARLLNHTLRLIEELGYYHVLSTISPYNYPSLKSVMSGQLVIRDLKNRDGVYRGRLRFLLARDLRKSLKTSFSNVVIVPNGEIERQMELLKEGYIGYELRKQEGFFEIVYGKPHS